MFNEVESLFHKVSVRCLSAKSVWSIHLAVCVVLGFFFFSFPTKFSVKEKQIFDNVDTRRETHAEVWFYTEMSKLHLPLEDAGHT